MLQVFSAESAQMEYQMLEKYFGSIANGLSQLSMVLVAVGLVVVMIIGIVFILKSVKT